MSGNRITYPQKDRYSYLWLLLALVLDLFSVSIGKWVLPVAAWLGPIFLLRFFRTQRRSWLAYLLAAIASVISGFIVMPTFMGPIAYVIIIGGAIIANLAPLADRLLVPRLSGFASTLVYPLAFTALEFINFGMTVNPMGSFGSRAYSQYNNLALLQLVSLTGMWGITFLMSWLASVVNWLWEGKFAWSEIKRGLTVYTGILLLVLAFGQARLWFASPPAQTVRVAGFTAVDFRTDQVEMMQTLYADREAFREMMAPRFPLYFEETIREARAGAKMILWPEYAATIAEEDESALLARAQEVAKQEGIYLAVPMMVMPRDDKPYANKLVVFDPQGQMVLEHFKYGGMGFEGNRINGDGILRTALTPFGVISGVICWDADYPGIVRQSGLNGTNILLSPSLEYREMDPIHAYMAVFRAIENGVSMVRVADNGLSVAVDPYGRILAVMDHFTVGERVIVAQIPTEGVWTLYPIIGDLFGWLSITGIAGFIVWGFVRGRREKRARDG